MHSLPWGRRAAISVCGPMFEPLLGSKGLMPLVQKLRQALVQEDRRGERNLDFCQRGTRLQERM